MRRVFAIAALGLGFSIPTSGQLGLGPITVLDCSPCGTVVGSISSAHSATVGSINANTTAQMQAAAAKIVLAITQSTAQITGAIEKNTSVIKTLADANIQARYIQSNEERAAQLRYDHAPGPQSCRTPSIGRVIRNTTTVRNTVTKDLKKRNTAWNKRATQAGVSSSSSARTARENKDQLLKSSPELEDQTISNVISEPTLTQADILLAELYTQQLTNPTPAPDITEDGENDSAEAWARQETRQRAIELAQGAFIEAVSRRTPATGEAFATGADGQPVSYFETLSNELERRFLDPQWAVNLQRAPNVAVLREQAMVQSVNLYVAGEILKELEQVKLILAAQLALNVDKGQ